MKYWWLEKYRDFKIIQIKELSDDINYFLIMPKNFEKKYEKIKEKDFNSLEEEELLILLKRIITTKNIKDNSLRLIIEKLLLIPDNSFPKSDYSLKEMLDEIKKLKENYPEQEKLNCNNIAVCYHCLNVFYIDKIKKVNKKNHCLCPFCSKSNLYFDNDYIPMNYTFIKLANIYYKTSLLGCRFKEVKKILKKNVKVLLEKENKDMIDLTKVFSKKIKPIDEKIINKKIYDLLIEKEKNFEHEATIYIKNISEDIDFKLLILLVSIMDILSSSVYLKEIKIVTNKNINLKIKELTKVLINS